MAISVNYYLKDNEAKGKTLVNIFISFRGERIKYSTRQKIEPKFWDSETQKIKGKYHDPHLRELLDQRKRDIESAYSLMERNGERITPELIRKKLDEIFNIHPAGEKDFFYYYNEFVEIKSPFLKPNTLRVYKTALNQLKEFEVAKRYKITFDSIDINFFEAIRTWHIKIKKHTNNSTSKHISILKTFLDWCTERNYNKNLDFKKFKAPRNEADIVYLTEEELMDLYSLNLTKNQRLAQVRDSFCFSCFTGLRFSDLKNINEYTIKKDELQIRTEKSSDPIKIPFNDFAIEILNRNDNKLVVISNQKLNKYLKELCKLAGIDEPTVITKYRGGEIIKIKEPKYNFITSHAGRRSFVTLCLEKGMRAETVMGITGHKDYKTFKKYIKITDKVKKIEMKKIWSKPTELRVAV